MIGAAFAQSAVRIMGVNVYKKSIADLAGSVHALALDPRLYRAALVPVGEESTEAMPVLEEASAPRQ